jgi:hypothetical protein
MCVKFGWTIQELYSQPLSKLERFATIMKIEGDIQQLESNNQHKGTKVG